MGRFEGRGDSSHGAWGTVGVGLRIYRAGALHLESLTLVRQSYFGSILCEVLGALAVGYDTPVATGADGDLCTWEGVQCDDGLTPSALVVRCGCQGSSITKVRRLPVCRDIALTEKLDPSGDTYPFFVV